MSGPRGSDFFVLLLRRCGCRLFSLLPVRTWRKGADGNVARRGTRENGTRMGGGAKERGRRKKGGMNERRSGWKCRTAGNAGIGTRMGGGAGKWRSKRAQAPFSAQTGLRPCGGGGGQGQEQGQGQGSGAGGTLRFAVSGAGRPFVEGEERTTPCRIVRQGVVYAVADAGVRDRASCGFPSEGPAC